MEFVVGLIVGVLIGMLLCYRPSAGALKIDQTNPEKDLYLFEIEDLDGLAKRKSIRLKVVKTAELSQE